MSMWIRQLCKRYIHTYIEQLQYGDSASRSDTLSAKQGIGFFEHCTHAVQSTERWATSHVPIPRLSSVAQWPISNLSTPS